MIYLLMQEGTKGPPDAFAMYLVPFILMLAVFYFIAIRPQQSQRQPLLAARPETARSARLDPGGGSPS